MEKLVSIILFTSIISDLLSNILKTKFKESTIMPISNKKKISNLSTNKSKNLIKPSRMLKSKLKPKEKEAFNNLKPNPNKLPKSSPVIIQNLKNSMIFKMKLNKNTLLWEIKSKLKLMSNLKRFPINLLWSNFRSMTANLKNNVKILKMNV